MLNERQRDLKQISFHAAIPNNATPHPQHPSTKGPLRRKESLIFYIEVIALELPRLVIFGRPRALFSVCIMRLPSNTNFGRIEPTSLAVVFVNKQPPFPTPLPQQLSCNVRFLRTCHLLSYTTKFIISPPQHTPDKHKSKPTIHAERLAYTSHFIRSCRAYFGASGHVRMVLLYSCPPCQVNIT